MSFIEFESRQDNPDFEGVSDVLAEELKTHCAQDPVPFKLVDVRRPDEYSGELGHIAGAELIVLDELEERIGELPKDQTIVFICRSGRRSASASLMAQQNGHTSVYNMLGGMMRWNELGFSTEK